jgi:membrane protease subunit HflK
VAGKPEWIGPKGPLLNIKVDFRLILIAVAGLVFLVWMLTGGPVYTVAPEEEGVVLTFGRYTRTTQPGLHFKWPWPVQTVEVPKVTQVKRLEIGFRSRERNDEIDYYDFSNSEDLLHEAQMLTGDENVVNCSMSVQFRIANAKDYLFNFLNEDEVTAALRDIAESALRQAVGDRPIDHALTTRKDLIQAEISLNIQKLADLYGCGVQIVAVQLQDVKPPKEVELAFREVASAREKREEIINKARGYQNEQIPQAEGEAQRIVLEATAYKESQVADARGQASRFGAVAREFALAPEITRTRMYLDTLAAVLPRMKVTIVDQQAGVLNFRNLTGGAAATPLASAAAPPGQAPFNPTAAKRSGGN